MLRSSWKRLLKQAEARTDELSHREVLRDVSVYCFRSKAYTHTHYHANAPTK